MGSSISATRRAPALSALSWMARRSTAVEPEGTQTMIRGEAKPRRLCTLRMKMFATTGGTVRRNKLSYFVDVRRSGIIAMKLDENEAIVDVQICTERDDVLLTAAGGQCIRFPVTDVRVFTGRTSMGVRGIALAEGDKLISLSILRHVEASSDERSAYLKMRRAVAGEATEAVAEEPADAEAEETSGSLQLSQERYADMSAQEQVVLTVSVNGYGKRTSSFEHPAPPAAAAKASSRCPSTTATASWWPHSRVRIATRSCW